MKKIYLKPAYAAMTMDENLPIANSILIGIKDTPVDNIEGDVKAGGDWDIWGNDVTED